MCENQSRKSESVTTILIKYRKYMCPTELRQSEICDWELRNRTIYFDAQKPIIRHAPLNLRKSLKRDWLVILPPRLMPAHTCAQVTQSTCFSQESDLSHYGTTVTRHTSRVLHQIAINQSESTMGVTHKYIYKKLINGVPNLVM